MPTRVGLRCLLGFTAITCVVVGVLHGRWRYHFGEGRETADAEWRDGELIWAPNPTDGFPAYRLMRSADLDPMSWYGAVANAEVQYDRREGHRSRAAELERAHNRPELPAGWLPPRMEDLWRGLRQAPALVDPIVHGDWRIEGAYSTHSQIGVRRTGAVYTDRIQLTWRGARPMKIPGDSFSWLPGPDAESICIGTWNERTLGAVYIVRPGLIAHAWFKCWRHVCDFRGDLRAWRAHSCPMWVPGTHGWDGGSHKAISEASPFRRSRHPWGVSTGITGYPARYPRGVSDTIRRWNFARNARAGFGG